MFKIYESEYGLNQIIAFSDFITMNETFNHDAEVNLSV